MNRNSLQCRHFAIISECVLCDTREHIILMCVKCDANTWHVVSHKDAICRKCDTVRSVDIKEGDQVVASGKRYAVKGISEWENAALLQHKELTLESLDG